MLFGQDLRPMMSHAVRRDFLISLVLGQISQLETEKKQNLYNCIYNIKKNRFYKDSKFLDRHVWANSADPDQTSASFEALLQWKKLLFKQINHHHHHHIHFRACFPLPRVGIFDKSFSKTSSPLRMILRVSRVHI